MPLLDLFFAMLWFFFFVLWIMLVIRVFADIFRSDDLGGFAKVLWTVFVIFLPLIGVLIYIIARGAKMAQRDAAAAAAQEAAFASYVKQTAGSSTGVADEIAKLAALRDNGTITAADYDAAKAKLLV